MDDLHCETQLPGNGTIRSNWLGSNLGGRASVRRYPGIRAAAHRGMALLVVMVLTMLIALGAYRYSFTMQAQYRISRVHEEQVQARLAALSGLELAATVLESSLNKRQGLGGMHSNPELFQHVSLGSSQPSNSEEPKSEQWFVSLVSPLAIDEDQSGAGISAGAATGAGAGNPNEEIVLSELRFGLENESAKLHIPTLLKWEREFPGQARAALMRLPQAEAGPVDAWLQRQGISSFGGEAGESKLLERLQDTAANSQSRVSLDWFRWRWFGGDLNQNYRLDPLELMLGASLSGETAVGTGLPAGSLTNSAAAESDSPAAWQHYLTWHSGHRNESAVGQPRVYLNQENLIELHRQLITLWPAELANFVIAMRQYGPGDSSTVSGEQSSSTSGMSNTLKSDATADSWTPDFSQPPRYQLTRLLDLLDVQLSVPSNNSSSSAEDTAASSEALTTSKKRVLRSPFSSEPTAFGNYNERLLDESTIEVASHFIGQIDIQHAPLEVLASVPGMDQALAETIVQQRGAASFSATTSRLSILWLLTDGLVDLPRLKELEPYLTCRSDVYAVQAVGYRDARTPIYRCTAIVDACQRPAQIVEHRAWHAWDRGFPVEQFTP